jgi:hypothetical protein
MMTYSRDLGSISSEIGVAFDGRFHGHGTVVRVRQTWEAFLGSLCFQYPESLILWLDKHAGGKRLSLNGFDIQFAEQAREWNWHPGETPDGPV